MRPEPDILDTIVVWAVVATWFLFPLLFMLFAIVER